MREKEQAPAEISSEEETTVEEADWETTESETKEETTAAEADCETTEAEAADQIRSDQIRSDRFEPPQPPDHSRLTWELKSREGDGARSELNFAPYAPIRAHINFGNKT